MSQVTETRELFTLHCQGAVLRGTFHKPPKDFPGTSSTGILSLAGFSMPRAAHGDAAVYWAASFANFGYPSFRLDLPGAGDSSADVPAELLQFVSTGGHERVAAAAVKQLVERYNLSGVVILGHCAGAISAIFAAAICRRVSRPDIAGRPVPSTSSRKAEGQRSAVPLVNPESFWRASWQYPRSNQEDSPVPPEKCAPGKYQFSAPEALERSGFRGSAHFAD